MNKRTIDEMIAYFNQEVSKMDISKENKIKLLGMITAIGYESKKQEVVRCKDCKFFVPFTMENKAYKICRKAHLGSDNFYCADGERRE